MVCDHSTVRIAFVIPYFYPALGYGGKPRLAYEMGRALSLRGHEITVLATDTGGPARIPPETIRQIQSNGLHGMHVHFYRNLSNQFAYRHRVFLSTAYFRDVRRRLAESDVVHIHDFRSFMSVGASRTALSLRKPFVLSPHGGLQHLGKKSAKLVFDLLWGNKILRNAAALCAVSPLEEHDAAAFGVERQRIHSLPPPIDTEQYKHLPQRGTFAAQWSLQNRKMILFLGRLHWLKGADILIEALSRLPELSALHLVIAGSDDGAERQLKERVQLKGLGERVTFTGFLDDRQKLNALVDSDVVVIPSRREGFPLTVLEAMACETPVILTSACDLGHWITPQRGLTTFRTEDPADLAEKIKTALCVRGERNMMGEARSFVLSEFSLDAIASRAEQLYRSLI